MRLGEIAPLGSERFEENTLGLSCDVYRSARRVVDCTLGGVSNKHADILLIGEGVDGPTTIQDARHIHNMGVLVLRQQRTADGTRYVAVPIDANPNPIGQYSFGGNFLYSGDSRFPGHAPIPIFDRAMDKETPDRFVRRV